MKKILRHGRNSKPSSGGGGGGGEDMSEYGDWQSKRKALREEYRELEAQAQ